jgi:energy-converting hydrogenase B subunit M
VWENTKRILQKYLEVAEMFKEISRSNAVHVMLVYTGGCNGCDIEVVNCVLSPYYDIEQYKVMLTWNPREADLLLVTGPVLKRIQPALKKIYDAIPDPKLVAAVGSCAINGNVYHNLGGDLGSSDEIAGPLDKVLPVAAKIPGCPPRPEDIIATAAVAIPILAKMEV